MVAADNVDVALVKFAEAAFLSAFAAEVRAGLLDFEGEVEIVFVLDNVASKGNGVVKTESLGSFDAGFFASFLDFVDLLFRVATGFG